MYPSIDTIKAILLKESYISEDDSAAAEAAAKDSAEYVDFLIRQELLTKSLLGQALAESHSLPFADLGINQLTKEQVAIIPEAISHASRVVMVRETDEHVTVA